MKYRKTMYSNTAIPIVASAKLFLAYTKEKGIWDFKLYSYLNKKLYNSEHICK